jgi:excisionase family DNA binding protein
VTTRPTDAAPWLTVAEAAAELRLTGRGVRAMVADGRLPAYRVGGRVLRIRRADLDLIVERLPTTGARRRAG